MSWCCTWLQCSPSWLALFFLSGCRCRWTPCHRAPAAPSGSSSASRPQLESVWICRQWQNSCKFSFLLCSSVRRITSICSDDTFTSHKLHLLLSDGFCQQSFFAFVPLFDEFLFLLKLLQTRLLTSEKTNQKQVKTQRFSQKQRSNTTTSYPKAALQPFRIHDSESNHACSQLWDMNFLHALLPAAVSPTSEDVGELFFLFRVPPLS